MLQRFVFNNVRQLTVRNIDRRYYVPLSGLLAFTTTLSMSVPAVRHPDGRGIAQLRTLAAQAENETKNQKGHIAVAPWLDWYRGSESNRHGIAPTKF